MPKLPIAAAVLALVTGMAALAQDLPTPPVDGAPPRDGMTRRTAPPLTRAAALAGAARGFALMDGDRDGVVTRAEYDAWRQRRIDMMAARRAEGDGGARAAGDGGGRGARVGSLLIGRDWFARADADGDGRVTTAEAQTAAATAFDRIDTNRDGMIDPDERRAALTAMRSERAPG